MGFPNPFGIEGIRVPFSPTLPAMSATEGAMVDNDDDVEMLRWTLVED